LIPINTGKYGTNAMFVVLDSDQKCVSVFDIPSNSKTKIGFLFDDLDIIPRQKTNIQLKFNDLGSSFEGKAVVSVIQKEAGIKWVSQETIAKRINRNISIRNWQNWFNSNHENITYSDHVKYSGTAVFANTGNPVPDSTILFAYLQKNLVGYETTVVDRGRFQFSFYYDFFGEDQFFLTASYKGRLLSDVKIDWDGEPTPLVHGSFTDLKTPFSSIYFDYRSKLSIIENSYKFSDETKALFEKNTNLNYAFEEEFLGADVTINVRDYVVFPTMVDLIKEIVPNLIFRSNKNKESVRVIFSNNVIKPVDDPLYIINGRMTKSTSYFLSLKPSEVLSIKVAKDIYKLNALGQIGKNGIVYVQTKDFVEPNDSIAFPYYKVSGLSTTKVSYDNAAFLDARIPFFKSTVYWNPLLLIQNGRINLDIGFTDDVGPILIRVDGVSHDGVAFSEQHEMTVKFKRQ